MTTFKPDEWPQSPTYGSQSFIVPGTQKPGESGHIRNTMYREFPTIGGNPSQTVTTLYECFETTLHSSPEYKCLGHRKVISGSLESSLQLANEYTWETYAVVGERRLNLGSAIQDLFASNKVGGKELPVVGIWTLNRPEWQIIDQALVAYSKISVALYSSLGKDAVEYIINHCELTLVFVSQQNLGRLIELAPKCPSLRVVVSIDELEETNLKNATEILGVHKIQFMRLSELEASGKAKPLPPIPPKPSDTATICYSSGTTGNPKGVVLTHWNLTSSAITFCQGLPITTPNPGIISYLPLAHIVGRTMELSAFLLGCRIGYYSGDPLKLLEDVQILKPTIFPAVPRILNRIAGKLRSAKAEGGLKGFLIRAALGSKMNRLHQDGGLTHWFWDFLIFNKLKAVLGGNVELIVSGAAPLVSETLDMLRVSFSCQLLEGWGLTETCGSGAKTWKGDASSAGTVGAPSSNVEIKLIDAPELSYSVDDKPNPRGELCVRGTSVFKEYYKDPAGTAAVLDGEGWFKTGDVGELDTITGRIKIIDRVKNVLKLSQGEYVATQKVEDVYSTSPLVFQLFVHGDSSENYLVGVLVPDLPAFAELVSKTLKTSVTEESKQELEDAAKKQEVNTAVMQVLNQAIQGAGLQGFEKIKAIHITLDQFTPENHMMTPTFKLRRREIENNYKDILKGLYAKADA